MAWQKGVSGNPTGLSAKQLRMLRTLEGLYPQAISRLQDLMNSQDQAIALAAIKEVMARVVPIPKAPLLAVQVNHSSPHLEALKALSVPQKVPQIETQASDIIESSSYEVLNEDADKTGSQT